MFDQGSVTSFLKTSGLTGNSLIDTLIITSLVPFVISYVTVFSVFLFKLVRIVGEFIVGTLISKLKETFSGKELCVIKVTQNDTLFEFFKSHIFIKKVASDKIAKSFFEGIGNMVKNEYDYKKYNKDWKKKRQNMVDIDVDYSNKRDSKFVYRSASVYHGEKEIKYFKYNEFVVCISLKKNSDNEAIKIKLYNTKNVHVTKADSVKILEKFFSDRFDLQQFVKYTFSVNINGNHSKKIKAMHKNTLLNANTGLLQIGDDVDSTSENINNNCFNLDLFCNTISSGVKFAENMKLAPTRGADMRPNDQRIGVKYYCNKYIGKNAYDDNYCDKYGYFWHESDLYLVFTSNSKSTIFIISPKSLSEKEIENRMVWFLETVAQNQHKKVETESKGMIAVYKYFANTDQPGKYYWSGTNIGKRNFDSMYLPTKTKKTILMELDNFFAKEKLYSKYQIPYKKGLLFYGPPGTGKTSLVKTIAYEYQINIYTININDESVNDESIMEIINSISGDNIKILLFEDIDSAFADKEKLTCGAKTTTHVIENSMKKQREAGNIGKKKDKSDVSVKLDAMMDSMASQMAPTVVSDKKYLTYSGLLNALDGVMSSQSGIITIMTTNYIDKLGSALIRPGRIDRKFELKECDSEQIFNMVRSFVDKFVEVQIKEKPNFVATDYIPTNYEQKVEDFVQKILQGETISKIKPCALQFYILNYIENVDDIFNNVDELFEP